MATTMSKKTVAMSHGQGILTVLEEESGERLIHCPFQDVAVLTQDTGRNSYTENSSCCIVMAFHSGRYARQMHVFQAKTSREVRKREGGGREREIRRERGERERERERETGGGGEEILYSYNAEEASMSYPVGEDS